MDFRQQLAKIADPSKELKPSQLCFLADLSAEQRQILKEVWPSIGLERRRRVVCEMVAISEDNVEFDFSYVFINALSDSDEQVRVASIDGLWENEGRVVLHRLYDMMRQDPSVCVRAAATTAMARFAYKAELGQLDHAWKNKIESALTSIFCSDSEPTDVRRRALEALSYFNGEQVPALIREAYSSPDESMKASAIYSMGHTLDRAWLDTIIDAMDSPSAQLRYEAARASGEIADRRAVEGLIRLVDDTDVEVRTAAIGALGQVGGKQAADTLARCARSEDPATSDAAQEALEELRFNSDPMML